MSDCNTDHPCNLCKKVDSLDLIKRLLYIEMTNPGTINMERLSELLAETTKT